MILEHASPFRLLAQGCPETCFFDYGNRTLVFRDMNSLQHAVGSVLSSFDTGRFEKLCCIELRDGDHGFLFSTNTTMTRAHSFVINCLLNGDMPTPHTEILVQNKSFEKPVHIAFFAHRHFSLSISILNDCYALRCRMLRKSS